MSQIILKNIKKVYEGKGYSVEALKCANININKGEMVAIIGTSGSGKSTLLNIIGVIDKCSEGEYYLDNKRIDKYTEKELSKIRNKYFGFVLQEFALIDNYTVAQNVVLPLKYSNIEKSKWNNRVKEILQILAIEDKYSMLPTNISGGQRQRVAIARALINDAEIILADEPTGALDSKTAKEIMNIFLEIKKQEKTIILVTHDMNIARYCDRIIKISDGMVIEEHCN